MQHLRSIFPKSSRKDSVYRRSWGKERTETYAGKSAHLSGAWNFERELLLKRNITIHSFQKTALFSKKIAKHRSIADPFLTVLYLNLYSIKCILWERSVHKSIYTAQRAYFRSIFGSFFPHVDYPMEISQWRSFIGSFIQKFLQCAQPWKKFYNINLIIRNSMRKISAMSERHFRSFPIKKGNAKPDETSWI